MTAIFSLLVIISLSILVTRIGALALVHTGLSKEIASFQARSAFMGVGFTTNESELLMSNHVRRKIVVILMFLGNAGVITTISSVIFSFLSLERTDSFLAEFTVLISGLLILFLLTQNSWVEKKLSKIINKVLAKYTDLDVRDYYRLLHLADDYQVSEIFVESNAWLAGKTLEKLELDAEGITVLGVKQGDKYIGAPDGDTKIKEDDVVILYGRSDLLQNLEKRKGGSSGDIDHNEAVNTHKMEKFPERQNKGSS